MKSAIRWVARADLDVEAYDRCIEHFEYPCIYGLSWYLDVMAEHWAAIVVGDYEAVMPVPYKNRVLFKQIYQPPLVQQLGLFGGDEHDERCFELLRHTSLYIDYTAHRCPDSIPHNKRRNFCLPLTQGWLVHWNNNRQRDLKKAEKLHPSFSEVPLATVQTTWFKSIPSDSGISAYQWQALCSHDSASKMIRCYEVSIDDRPMIRLLTAEYRRRLYYLLPFVLDKKSKEYGLSTYMIHAVLRYRAGYVDVLDLEGSEIEGVARFYTSLGATPVYYAHLRQRPIHWLRHMR